MGCLSDVYVLRNGTDSVRFLIPVASLFPIPCLTFQIQHEFLRILIEEANLIDQNILEQTQARAKEEYACDPVYKQVGIVHTWKIPYSKVNNCTRLRIMCSHTGQLGSKEASNRMSIHFVIFNPCACHLTL